MHLKSPRTHQFASAISYECDVMPPSNTYYTFGMYGYVHVYATSRGTAQCYPILALDPSYVWIFTVDIYPMYTLYIHTCLVSALSPPWYSMFVEMPPT